MNTDYMEKESSKKKFLAPLVVIMLCLVAITGAAYAYSTSVTGNGDIAGNYIVLDMHSEAKDTSATEVFHPDSNAVNIYTTTDKTEEPDYKGFVVDGTQLTFSTYVIVKTNLTGKTFKLNDLTDDDFKYAAGTGKETTTCKLKLSNLQITSIEDTSGNAQTVLNGNEYYKVTLTLDVTGAMDDGSVGSYTEFSDLKTNVLNLQYADLSITLTAVEYTEDSIQDGP